MKEKALIFRLSVVHFVSRWILFPLCYYVIRYRRKVVARNLQLVFPYKSKSERKQIERAFYLYFCDMLMEILFGRNFTAKQMRRFVTLHESDQMQADCAKYGGCFIMMGHFMNWEWISALSNQLCEDGRDFGVVYRRLTNAYFDDLMQRLRNKKGGFVIEMGQLLRVMISHKNMPDSNPIYYAMLADQRPRKQAKAKQYWTTLLGQEVGMMTGSEQLAMKFEYPVYYAYLYSTKRGFYEASFISIYDPKEGNLPVGEITERFTRQLEKNIIRQPERWLWTHNRFSQKKPITQ